jgi:ABC-2 type transport system ATP-binding protein
MRDWAGSRVRGYSKGMRQRVGIAQALMNDPKLVLLDEPTDGVDPVGRREIRGIVERMRDEGRTVFLNSHLLSELEMVCERVAILVKGRIASQGTLDELTADQRCYELDLALPDRGEEPPGDRAVTALLPGYRDEPTPGDPGASVRAAASAGEVPASLRRRGGTIGALDDGVWVHVEHTTVRIGTQDAQRVQPVLDALRAKNVTIRSMKPHRPSLEDLFIAAVTDPTTGRAFAPGADRKGEHGKAGPTAPTPEPPTSGPPTAEPREETTP